MDIGEKEIEMNDGGKPKQATSNADGGDDTSTRLRTANHANNVQPANTNSQIKLKSGAKNSEMTPGEKLRKRQLKAHLKQKMRLRKYETRWNQARLRQDKAVEASAKKEYEDYYEMLLQKSDSVLHTSEKFQQYLQAPNTLHSSRQQQPTAETSAPIMQQQQVEDINNSNTANTSSKIMEGVYRKWIIENVWNPLQKVVFTKSDKVKETSEARELLHNMTKGTQTKSMFVNNNQALLGYTRQKFVERAVLASASLHRYFTLYENIPKMEDLPSIVWSIGCGPGCDAVGIACFYDYYQHQQKQTQHDPSPSSRIDRLILMDFVMPQWNEMVVNDLIQILKQKCHIPTIETTSCDVCHSLTKSSINETASSHILRQCTSSSEVRPLLVVVSYLLTETNGKWNDFFRDVMELLPSGSLLLLSEPVAWQLHIFLDSFSKYIDRYQWLDSSHNNPDLQKLDNRMGPACVILRTKR